MPLPEGYKHSEETRKKISKSRKGQIPWNKGRHLSKEHRRKLSIANQGKRHSKETRQKISIAHKGKVPWMKGRNHTEETKRKIGETRKGKRTGSKHPLWKGGKYICHGYVFLLSPHHPYRNNQGYVREHRLVIEKELGRYLKPEETCHHINEDKTDNRLENLMAFSSQAVHVRWHKDPSSVKQEEIIFDSNIERRQI